MDDFPALTEPYRNELLVHCYRILGSFADAEDLVQETLLAAWRGLDDFQGRASVRTWLYKIATNRCLNALRARSRRPVEPDPFPDVQLPDEAPGPEARYEAKEAIELAFVVALQRMSPGQRTVLVLRDVLGYRAAEVAEMLDTSEAGVNAALQRARAKLDERLPGRDRAARPSAVRERELVERFAAAIETGDVPDVIALLSDDALLTMPPQDLEFLGQEAIGAFLRERAELRGGPLRAVPTGANGQPAFGCYLPDGRPWGLLVLSFDADAISAITWFSDTALFSRFGLPPQL
jgi:RNA polymerase sigma-70 factor (ECF subfamily)